MQLTAEEQFKQLAKMRENLTGAAQVKEILRISIEVMRRLRRPGGSIGPLVIKLDGNHQ